MFEVAGAFLVAGNGVVGKIPFKYVGDASFDSGVDLFNPPEPCWWINQEATVSIDVFHFSYMVIAEGLGRKSCDDILMVDESKRSISEACIELVLKCFISNAWLTECVDAADGGVRIFPE